VFNLLGPLTNPADAPYALIGAWSLDTAALMADALSGMPIARMFVVHGETGWDEPTPAAPFALFDVRPGSVTRYRREAADFGLDACRPEDLKGADAAHNAARLAAVLRGKERGAHRDALVMGAALVLEVTGLAPDPRAAAIAAAAAIDDGRAARVLDALAAFGASQADEMSGFLDQMAAGSRNGRSRPPRPSRSACCASGAPTCHLRRGWPGSAAST